MIVKINAQMEEQDHMDSNERLRASRRQPEVYPTRPKLPDIQLPKFDGNPMKWLNFWDYFHTVIHENPGIPVIDKFHYLISLSEGKAKMAVEYLPRHEDMYLKALDILERRFGGRKLRHQALYQRLRSLPPVGEKVSLRFVVEEVDHVIQQTRNLKGTVDEVAVMTIFQEKLPKKNRF